MKEKIIEATIDLIENSNGEVNNITIRKIAEVAGVGVGLINYHFDSKENLIEICVERIINDVVKNYNPKPKVEDEKQRVYATVNGVADYLWSNKNVSKISILSDINNPKIDDNTMKSIYSFLNTTNTFDNLKAYLLVIVLQSVFLKPEVVKEFFKIDTEVKEQRDRLIKNIIDVIVFGGDYENSNI